MSLLDFYRTSRPSATAVPPDRVRKTYKKMRFQSFVAATLGYSLYYVCRTTLNVVKKPIIDEGILDAAQLGIVSSCLLFAYAVCKFINGFLVDYSNTRRFMATGLIISTLANLVMGIMGVFQGSAAVAGGVFLATFAIMWAFNGASQAVGAPCAIVSLTRWYPLSIRGTYYGFFSASHNIGEWLSFLFVGLIVTAFGWQWGFFGAAAAGAVGVVLILLLMHDTPESSGLPAIEVLSDEMSAEEYEAGKASADAGIAARNAETRRLQKQVLRNPGVWILALASSFMYMSRYAVNGWGVLFLQESKGFSLTDATFIISINAVFGILGTVFSGWLTDVAFKGDRKIPALVAGILEAIALALFLFGGNQRWINILAMILFGIAIGVLISFLGGLMAIDIVPRKATGAALGIVGMASYAAAGLQDVVSGLLIENNSTIVDGVKVYDFTSVAWFWIGAAIISFLLPILNWKRQRSPQESQI